MFNPPTKLVFFFLIDDFRIGAYEPTAPLVRNPFLGLSSAVESRQAHLPEVEWNTRVV